MSDRSTTEGQGSGTEQDPPEIRRVLVAARGAAAARLARSVVEAGLEAVVLLDDRDEEASWARPPVFGAWVPAGPAGWPDPEAVLAAAVDAGCDALLPGWDELARDPDFAERCARAGLVWLGVPRELLTFIADRARVREQAESLDIQVVPGTRALTDPALASAWAAGVGFPVALKATRGHDRPLVRVDSPDELEVAAAGMLEEGPAMVERYVLEAREIEVPVAGDGEEAVVALGTREVTGRVGDIRRLWSAPATALQGNLEEEIMQAALNLVASLGWRGVGAVQFLLTPDGRAYLLDLRPGLHPADAVTERVYGVDIVDAALRVGMGQRLGWGPDEAAADGFAMGVRLRVSDDAPPSRLGKVQAAHEVKLFVDEGSVLRAGDELGCILVHGMARHPAIVRTKVVLDELDLPGAHCALPALRRVLGDPQFWLGILAREDAQDVAGIDPDR